MPHIGEYEQNAISKNANDFIDLIASNPRQLGETCMNEDRTCATSSAKQTQVCSRDVLRREMILTRNKHGAMSAIGARCSTIVELIQMPELPQALYDRQMADLRKLLAAGE
jgi:hypothetical protein